MVTKTLLSFSLWRGGGTGSGVMGVGMCICFRQSFLRGRWQIKHSYIPYF